MPKKGIPKPRPVSPEIQERKDAILKVVQEERVRTQEELVEALKKRNVFASRATISRELDKLGISTLNGYYETKEVRQLAETRQYLGTLITERVKLATNKTKLLALNVDYGFSEPIARFIDTAFDGLIAGTITGPHVVMIIAPDNPEGNKALETILSFVPQERIAIETDT